MAEDTKDEGMLSRWSRRKRAVAEAELVDAPDQIAIEVQDVDDEHEAQLIANREAAEAIDLETLDADSDFSLFMKEGVPEALKRKALSILWRTNPVFANVDGLVDYDDDFGDPSLIMKTFTSAYQVGKGYLKEVLEEDDDDDVVAPEEKAPSSGDGDIGGSDDEQPPAEDKPLVTQNDSDKYVPDPVDESHCDLEVASEITVQPKVPLRKRLSLEA